VLHPRRTRQGGLRGAAEHVGHEHHGDSTIELSSEGARHDLDLPDGGGDARVGPGDLSSYLRVLTLQLDCHEASGPPPFRDGPTRRETQPPPRRRMWTARPACCRDGWVTHAEGRLRALNLAAVTAEKTACRRPAASLDLPSQGPAPRGPELVLFKLLPVAVVALMVFTPWGQALQLRAAQVFGARAAQVVKDGTPTTPAPLTPQPTNS